MEEPIASTFELYQEDDEPRPETPDLLEKYSSSEQEHSNSEDSDPPSSPTAAIPSIEPAIYTARDRDVSSTTTILLGNDEDEYSNNDPFYDINADVSKPSDVFSTLSDEDANLSLPLPHAFSPRPSHDFTLSTPTSNQKHRERAVFRNPSSVRAMQMSSPHPFPPFSPSPRSARFRRSGTYDSSIVGSRNGTPLRSVLGSAETRKPKKEYPLVLLHVTITPLALPYSTEAMEELLPPWVLENYALLREKAGSTLLQRGMLIAHPRDDYELLEERVLESLELRIPRIYKCGHFDGGERCASARSHHSDETENVHVAKRECAPNACEGLDALDGEPCGDCGRVLHSGEFGTGSGGSRRWDIKIYAANGLMRAGAWAAAWAEMEKVDLEIGVWVPEESRVLLEERRTREENCLRQTLSPEPEMARQQTEDPGYETRSNADQHMATERSLGARISSQSRTPHETQLPLSTLLSNYVIRLAHDPRNMAIGFLSLLLISLWLRPATPLHVPVHSQATSNLPACTFVAGAQVPSITMLPVKGREDGVGIGVASSLAAAATEGLSVLAEKLEAVAEETAIPKIASEITEGIVEEVFEAAPAVLPSGEGLGSEAGEL